MKRNDKILFPSSHTTIPFQHDKQSWTDNEIKKLIQLCNTDDKSWIDIANKFDDKSNIDCHLKFVSLTEKSKKGNWANYEDELLLDWVKEKGAKNWAKCALTIPGRTGKQCRERWKNSLDPLVKRGNWSINEQIKMFEAMKVYWYSWSAVSKCLSGRTENSIKNYFYSSVRRIKQNKIWNFLLSLFFPIEFKFKCNK